MAAVTYFDTMNPSARTTARLNSERPVQEADPANTAPKFADDQDHNTPGNQADAEREVVENEKGATVGDAVTASDTDLLMYTIGGTDAASFEIGRDTGQITTKAKLDYETKSSYTVVVTATDPSGATDTLNVNVTVTDENDKAVITGDKAIDYAENGTAAADTYTATDQDGDTLTWGLDGDDKADFEISDAGVLTFKKKPDFEKPADDDTDNVYMVTVTATGGTPSNTGELKVEITVTDVDEDGKVTLNQPQPQVGRSMAASGPADPDTPVSDPRWQWSRGSTSTGPWTDIDKATSESRTPNSDDENMYLRATVTYTDRHGEGKTASGVSENAVESKTVANAAPSFKHQDETGPTIDDDPDGDQGIQDDIIVNRKVDEKVKGANVGKPVAARDADGDILLYELIDGDTGTAPTLTEIKAWYKIDARTGQISTKVDTLASDNDGDSDTNVKHVIGVKATDPSSASTEQPVTITITDVNDAPMFLDYDGDTTGRQSPPKTLWVTEITGTAGTGVNTDKTLRTKDSLDDTDNLDAATYTVEDADQSDTAGTNGFQFTYTLEGPDKDKFHITNTGQSGRGVLTVCTAETTSCGAGKSHDPNYEKQSSYSITIKAADDDGAAASIDVTVKVRNFEDFGKVSLSQREPQVNRPVVATLSDPDGGIKGVKWQWYWNNVTTPTARDTAFPNTACIATSSSLCLITGATSPSYTPTDIKPSGVTGSTAWFLTARVTYTDAYVTDTVIDTKPAGSQRRPAWRWQG